MFSPSDLIRQVKTKVDHLASKLANFADSGLSAVEDLLGLPNSRSDNDELKFAFSGGESLSIHDQSASSEGSLRRLAESLAEPLMAVGKSGGRPKEFDFERALREAAEVLGERKIGKIVQVAALKDSRAAIEDRQAALWTVRILDVLRERKESELQRGVSQAAAKRDADSLIKALGQLVESNGWKTIQLTYELTQGVEASRKQARGENREELQGRLLKLFEKVTDYPRSKSVLRAICYNFAEFDPWEARKQMGVKFPLLSEMQKVQCESGEGAAILLSDEEEGLKSPKSRSAAGHLMTNIGAVIRVFNSKDRSKPVVYMGEQSYLGFREEWGPEQGSRSFEAETKNRAAVKTEIDQQNLKLIVDVLKSFNLSKILSTAREEISALKDDPEKKRRVTDTSDIARREEILDRLNDKIKEALTQLDKLSFTSRVERAGTEGFIITEPAGNILKSVSKNIDSYSQDAQSCWAEAQSPDVELSYAQRKANIAFVMLEYLERTHLRKEIALSPIEADIEYFVKFREANPDHPLALRLKGLEERTREITWLKHNPREEIQAALAQKLVQPGELRDLRVEFNKMHWHAYAKELSAAVERFRPCMKEPEADLGGWRWKEGFDRPGVRQAAVEGTLFGSDWGNGAAVNRRFWPHVKELLKVQDLMSGDGDVGFAAMSVADFATMVREVVIASRRAEYLENQVARLVQQKIERGELDDATPTHISEEQVKQLLVKEGPRLLTSSDLSPEEELNSELNKGRVPNPALPWRELNLAELVARSEFLHNSPFMGGSRGSGLAWAVSRDQIVEAASVRLYSPQKFEGIDLFARLAEDVRRFVPNSFVTEEMLTRAERNLENPLVKTPIKNVRDLAANRYLPEEIFLGLRDLAAVEVGDCDLELAKSLAKRREIYERVTFIKGTVSKDERGNVAVQSERHYGINSEIPAIAHPSGNTFPRVSYHTTEQLQLGLDRLDQEFFTLKEAREQYPELIENTRAVVGLRGERIRARNQIQTLTRESWKVLSDVVTSPESTLISRSLAKDLGTLALVSDTPSFVNNITQVRDGSIEIRAWSKHRGKEIVSFALEDRGQAASWVANKSSWGKDPVVKEIFNELAKRSQEGTLARESFYAWIKEKFPGVLGVG